MCARVPPGAAVPGACRGADGDVRRAGHVEGVEVLL